MGNTSYTRLITETLQRHGTEIFDAISTNNALFYMLKKRGNIKLSPGGRVFTHPIYWLQNPSFQSYAKLGVISTSIPDDITRAEYPIKCVAGSLVLSMMEEAMNAGSKEKLIDMAKKCKEAAQISMSQVMGVQVWATGTVATDFDGIQHLVSLTPTTGTVGGINRANAADAYWRNQLGTAITAFATHGVSRWNTLLNNCTFGDQGPKAVFTTKTAYGLYEATMTSNIRYYQTELADTAFRHLAFATMPVLFDDNCPNERAYFLDLNSLWLQLLSRGNFQVTEFQQAINQLSRIALMYVFGNITMGSGRTQGIVSITG